MYDSGLLSSDRHAEILAEGAVVLGFSRDDADSHRDFRERQRLPFPLLVDDEAAVATRFGAWGERALYGRRFEGMTRSTFIIGPDGILTRVSGNVPGPPDMARRLLKALRESA